jgi:hypothetical protein
VRLPEALKLLLVGARAEARVEALRETLDGSAVQIGRKKSDSVLSCLEARGTSNLGNSYSFRKQAKLPKRLVDETGIEPATSSLRTRRSPS